MALIPSDWWKTSFGKSYLKQYEWQEKLTKRQVAFVKKHVKKEHKYGFLLDAACGSGRHSIPLVKENFYVVGFDTSMNQLKEANKHSEDYRKYTEFRNVDIRNMPLEYQHFFHVVINMFSSFGYFNSKDNFETLREFSRVLRKEGTLILDLINPFDVDPKMIKRGRFVCDRELNPFSFQLYTKQEISKLARKAGFYKLSFFGDYESHPYKKDSPRLILVAKKK